MLALLDRRRIVHFEPALVAVMVGQRHEQVEPVTRRQQRRGRARRLAHAGGGVVHQFRHAGAVERRLEPARAHEQREFAAHLGVADFVDAANIGNAPQEWPHVPFAAGLGPGLGRQELRHVRAVEPQVAQRIGAQVVGEGARQHRAVDAARRGAGDDVDDDAQVDLPPDLAQQFEIDRFGVVFGIGEVELVRETGAETDGAVHGVERAGGADQL